jgi:hypothetical protein
MNETERAALLASIKEAIGERMKAAGINDNDFIAKIAGRLADLEQRYADIGTGAPSIRGLDIANPFEGDHFKQRVKQLADGQPTTGNILLPNVGIKSLKALVTLPSGGTSGFPTQPQRGPTLDPAQVPLTLVDVLPSTPVSADTYEFVQISRVNNAGVQASEGDQKPETEFDADLETAKIATIAHWTQASRQVLSDNSQLSAMLSRVLSIDVVSKYEGLLLNGNGTTDKIHGLVPQATPFAHTKTHKPDRISECLAAMWAAGYVGSVVIMNPFDWSDFETERADSGDGQYVAGGWANPAAPTVWRAPVARAAGLAQGSALVLDSRFVTMLDRTQVSTAVSAEDRDNFIRNLITMLAEMRGGLAVYNTDAVQLVDLAST